MFLGNISSHVLTWVTLTLCCSLFVCGCGGPVTIKGQPPIVKSKEAKSPITVTLIDTRTKIENPVIRMQETTVILDEGDAVYKVINDALSAQYERVDISPTPITTNDMYATVIVNARRSDLSYDGGIATTAKVGIFNTKTKENLASSSVTIHTQFELDKASIRAAGVLMIGTAFVGAPIALPIIKNKGIEAATAAYSKHLSELSTEIQQELKYKRVISLDHQIGQETSSNIKRKRTNTISQEQMDFSISAAEKCKREISWLVGNTVKMVSCLNSSWQDYTVFVEGYVDEFKSYRLNLAKKVDAGEMTLDEYNVAERKARDTLVWHTTITDGYKVSEKLLPKPSFGPENLSNSNSESVTPGYKTIDGRDVMNALTAVLGFAFKAAMIAAPYAFGYSAGANASSNAWASYASRPRVVTCTPLGGGLSSCF